MICVDLVYDYNVEKIVRLNRLKAHLQSSLLLLRLVELAHEQKSP